MSFKTKFTMIVLSASLALYAIAGAWLATRAQQPANDPGAQQRIFESVLQHIQDDYVDQPNMEKVRAGALRGLAYGLDPYSTYLTPDQVKDYRAGAKSNQAGIGAELSQASSFLYVVAPVKGSPADQAGVRAGDVIEYIDGKATRDIRKLFRSRWLDREDDRPRTESFEDLRCRSESRSIQWSCGCLDRRWYRGRRRSCGFCVH